MIVNSIATVSKTYETMSRPLRIYCSDFKHYVGKFGRTHDLLNEIIAAEFAKLWGIRVPDFAYIRLLPEHVPSGLNKNHFNRLGFGSEYLEHAQELSKILLTWKANSYEIGRIVNREDLLRIGLFDLWMANEDRNHNNANLLIQPTVEGFHLVAIDHVNIFNTNMLDKGLNVLTMEESILYSDYITLLFKKEKLQERIIAIEKEFPGYVALCQKSLGKLLETIPSEWGIDIALQQRQMEQIFKLEWTKEVIQSFKLYIARNFA